MARKRLIWVFGPSRAGPRARALGPEVLALSRESCQTPANPSAPLEQQLPATTSVGAAADAVTVSVRDPRPAPGCELNSQGAGETANDAAGP